MKKFFALVLLTAFVLPIIGCGEQTETVDSSKPVVIDSGDTAKKGPIENNKGINE